MNLKEGNTYYTKDTLDRVFPIIYVGPTEHENVFRFKKERICKPIDGPQYISRNILSVAETSEEMSLTY